MYLLSVPIYHLSTIYQSSIYYLSITIYYFSFISLIHYIYLSSINPSIHQSIHLHKSNSLSIHLYLSRCLFLHLFSKIHFIQEVLNSEKSSCFSILLFNGNTNVPPSYSAKELCFFFFSFLICLVHIYFFALFVKVMLNCQII